MPESENKNLSTIMEDNEDTPTVKKARISVNPPKDEGYTQAVVDATTRSLYLKYLPDIIRSTKELKVFEGYDCPEDQVDDDARYRRVKSMKAKTDAVEKDMTVNYTALVGDGKHTSVRFKKKSQTAMYNSLAVRMDGLAAEKGTLWSPAAEAMETERGVNEATLKGEHVDKEQVVAEEEMDDEELVQVEASVADDMNREGSEASGNEKMGGASGRGNDE